MTDDLGPGPHGPLASVLAVRSRTGVLEHREALVYTLGKAAELEHLVMLQYLFAAFSLKQDVSEGVTADQLVAIKRWRKTLLEISAQEMLHLALVQNLLTSVGAAPRFARPNFPMPAYAYPAGVRIELLPFGEAALRHFAFLERPEGMDVEDAEGFEAFERAGRLRARPRGRDRPPPPGVRDDRGALPGRSGWASSISRAGSARSGCSSGRRTPRRPRSTSAGRSSSPSPTSRPRRGRSRRSSSRARAPRASGATPTSGGCWASSTSSSALKAADPTFEPARPVVAANVRQQATGVVVPLITDPGTARAMDLLNVVYEVLLQLLSRYFAHSDETPEQLQVLAEVSVGLMYSAIKPLGSVVTTLPIGWDMPGVTAGPGFELFYQVDYLLPHREAAWVLMEERLRDAAAFAVRCGEACTPSLMEPLAKVARALEKYADQLLAAS